MSLEALKAVAKLLQAIDGDENRNGGMIGRDTLRIANECRQVIDRERRALERAEEHERRQQALNVPEIVAD